MAKHRFRRVRAELGARFPPSAVVRAGLRPPLVAHPSFALARHVAARGAKKRPQALRLRPGNSFGRKRPIFDRTDYPPQPQLGAGAQHEGWQQLGAQHVRWQQRFSLWQKCLKPQQRFWQQLGAQQGAAQHDGSAQQVGAGAQHVGAASQHVGSQQVGSQHDPQPPPQQPPPPPTP